MTTSVPEAAYGAIILDPAGLSPCAASAESAEENPSGSGTGEKDSSSASSRSSDVSSSSHIAVDTSDAHSSVDALMASASRESKDGEAQELSEKIGRKVKAKKPVGRRASRRSSSGMLKTPGDWAWQEM